MDNIQDFFPLATCRYELLSSYRRELLCFLLFKFTIVCKSYTVNRHIYIEQRRERLLFINSIANQNPIWINGNAGRMWSHSLLTVQKNIIVSIIPLIKVDKRKSGGHGKYTSWTDSALLLLLLLSRVYVKERLLCYLSEISMFSFRQYLSNDIIIPLTLLCSTKSVAAEIAPLVFI